MYTNTIEKIQRHGLKWFLRRLVREFIKPTTSLGQFLKPISPLIYHLISKPINWMNIKRVRNSFKYTVTNTLYFFYDFEIEPITFDFVWALSVANAKREELSLDFLHVVFVPGTFSGLRKESSEYEGIVNYDSRVWRIDSILIPCVKLLPCSYAITLCATRNEASQIRQKQAKFVYPLKYNVTFPISYDPEQAMVYGQKSMCLRADNKAKEYVSEWLRLHAGDKKTIIITLRQYGYTLERNSNIDAWARFASEIDKENFLVVFVPDTEQALHGIPPELSDFLFFQPACWNLNLRGALYELAYLNLGVNTGPMSLCWFNSQCRYITFKTAVKNVREIPLEMLLEKGFVLGMNPAFANKFQKWVWDDDDFEVIHREFKLMCKSLETNLINEEV